MQHQGALAYQQTARQTAGPRDLEANLLTRMAMNLQKVRDNWGESTPGELTDILNRNRRVWSFFIAAVTDEKSPLPVPVRENVANLGIFIMSQTFEIMANPKPEMLDSLININRQIAAGLRGSNSAAA